MTIAPEKILPMLQLDLRALRAELEAIFVEREDAIEAMLLALLVGEHAIMIGPPGTAKSALVRTLTGQIRGARYFEVALSKTRPAEAVLGPLDIKEFRENGNYLRKHEGYATDVEFAFLDEIGKMSADVGHDLLALLNERIRHEVQDGRSAHATPLSSAFCASNELLTSGSDDAVALWDRLLLRVTVSPISSSHSFQNMLRDQPDPIETVIDWNDLKMAIDTVIPAIKIEDSILESILEIRAKLAKENIRPSDRRWRVSMKVLRASAYLNERESVEHSDLMSLSYTLWGDPEEIEKVRSVIASVASPHIQVLMELQVILTEVNERIDEIVNANDDFARLQYTAEGGAKLERVRDRLDTMLLENGNQVISGFRKVSEKHAETVHRMLRELGRQSEEQADITVSTFLGMGHGPA